MRAIKDPRSERTEESLRGAFLDLMRKKAFADIKVSEIAKAAGISRKAFYDHYADINDLVFDCFLTHLCPVPDFRVESFTDPKDLVECCVDGWMQSLEFCQENRAFAKLVYETSLYSRYLSRIPSEGAVVMLRSVEDIQPPDNMVRKALDLGSEEIARLYFMGSGFTVSDWIDGGMTEDIELVARRIIYLAFHLSDIYSASDGACAELKKTLLEGVRERASVPENRG